MRVPLCSGKENEIFLTEQNKSLIEEVAWLEAQTEEQNGQTEDLKEAVRALQHHIVETESFIWMKDELVRKQTSEIAGMKELTEVLFLHISDLKKVQQWTWDAAPHEAGGGDSSWWDGSSPYLFVFLPFVISPKVQNICEN